MPLLLIALGLVLLGTLPIAGIALAGIGAVSLYFFSAPVFAHWLIDPLQSRYPVLDHVPPDSQVIVVLGGGRNRDAQEYGGDTVDYFTLERIRYAARLQRITQLPILASGGSLHGEVKSEASLMKEALEYDFKTPVRWGEGHSRDTYQNALNAARVLQEHQITRALLVTHGWHMPRAVWSFRKAGVQVTPAPTANGNLRSANGFIPHYRALYMATNALSEYLAMAWYRLKYSRG